MACRKQYPKPVRLALWLMMELAIIGSDIQEVRWLHVAVLASNMRCFLPLGHTTASFIASRPLHACSISHFPSRFLRVCIS